jgi:CheY-like chemotaxis protein
VPHTLLLADDSVTIQRVIELTFADEDVQVVAVSDGDQAIARLESAPPDIVLADIGMPGRDGYEVARYVKQSPRLSHIPVVLLTGAFEPVDQAKVTEVGCDGVLAKPFEPQLVIGRVRELLTSELRRPESSSKTDAPAAPDLPQDALIEPSAHAQASQPESPDLDDYFDRLDVAFAKLAGQPVGKGVSEPVETESPQQPPPETPSLSEQIDWYADRPAESLATMPVSYASPAEAFEAPPPAPHVSSKASEEKTPAAPLAAAAAPSLGEAFAAILAAERHESLPEGHPQWPSSFAPPPPAPLEITDEVIDRVARRVLDQMSDRVVRETVHEIVAEIAERLVREEIEKIKAALK